MKRKKMLAFLAALVLAFNLSTAAFAVEGGGETPAAPPTVETEATPGSSVTTVDQGTTGADATVKVPTVLRLPVIQVTVSIPSKIIVNPYKLAYSYTPEGKDAPESHNEQIINAPTTITNNSGIGVKVTVTPTVEEVTSQDGDVEFADSESPLEDGADSTKKKVRMRMTLTAAGKADTLNYTNGTKAFIVSPAGGNSEFVLLDAVNATEANNVAGYKFTGETFTGSAASWNDGDKVKVTVTFKIEANLGAAIKADGAAS